MSESESRVVRASRVIAAPADVIFEEIADPSRQPAWDGNDNLGSAPEGQRVRATGEVFSMTLGSGAVRENHVVEFEEGRRIAWKPSEEGKPPIGHLWRWELEPADGGTLVTQTYDWTQLRDESRLDRARRTQEPQLLASIDRLKALLEG
ncbi:SRPBCC family protein [Agrococcus sp. TF02-05]|uniref:SRPBCC family protein n=1 Tax=Agrococcus sp. TF02-05 TaxID=2815211 RepID=UPI001AA1A377|nr:SRPBCC family protein [Agrococcus sp. TF02-05]MBO1770876.1 SRPBCC family protein [Agrococcus sp. TF02-05]